MSTVYFAPSMALKPLLIALATALPVYANASVSASASAQITGLTYRLVDLDTNDGIAPTITFNNQINTFLNHTSYYVPDGYASAYDASAPYTGLLPDTALNTSLISESATATSQGFFASASASTNEAFANIDPANRFYEGFSVRSESSLSVNPGLYDDLGNPISITLSANTALFISGVATVKGQFDKDAFVAQAAAMPGLNDAYVQDYYDMVGASARLDLSTQSFETDEYGNVFATTINSSSSQLTNAYGEANFEWTKSLNVQFANLTDADTKVILGIQANAHANLEGSLDFRDLNIVPDPPVTPPSIPEPGTYLLMGLGLAGIGLARRRTSV